MKNFLLMFIAFTISVAIGLSVVAEDESQNLQSKNIQSKSLQQFGSPQQIKELPPPLPGEVVTTTTTKTQTTIKTSTHAIGHITACNTYTPIYQRSCGVRGQPIRNILRWLFRRRCRWRY